MMTSMYTKYYMQSVHCLPLKLSIETLRWLKELASQAGALLVKKSDMMQSSIFALPPHPKRAGDSIFRVLQAYPVRAYLQRNFLQK